MKAAATLPLAFTLLVLAGSSCDLLVALRRDDRRVSDEAMRTAVAEVQGRYAQGSLIVHSPLFGVRELRALGDLPARPDRPSEQVMRTRRVLVLDHSAFRMFGLGRASQVIPLPEGLELRIFEPVSQREVLLFDLYDSLGPEILRIERPPGVVRSRCRAPRTPNGFSCPGEAEWLYAARTTLRVEGQDVPCVWSHPTTGGVVVLELPAQPDPPPGRHLLLRLEAGLSDDAVLNTSDGAEVATQVMQGGRERARLIVPNRTGWFEATMGIAPGVPIELKVTTPRDGRRHHGLNARIFEVEDGESQTRRGLDSDSGERAHDGRAASLPATMPRATIARSTFAREPLARGPVARGPVAFRTGGGP